jgi:hypothetical protein
MGKSDNQISLRFFEPARPDAHLVPASSMTQALDSLQRLIHLLAMRREGRVPGRRIRPSADVQERYRLVCELPMAGSYFLPIHIEGQQLLSDVEGSAVAEDLTTVLTAVGNASEADLEAFIPDETWRRFVLDALERLSPSRASGVEMQVLRGDDQILDTTKSRPFVERVMRSPARHRASGVILGELKRIDFVKREITVRHIRSGRDLTGVYNDYVEQTLLDNPRATILVFGTITRDTQGPESIDGVERIEPVDVNPFEVKGFVAGNTNVVAREELSAIIVFDEDEAVFTADMPSLRLQVRAVTRDSLADAVADELALLWKRYAIAADEKLTPAARTLKNRMLAAFREVQNATKTP